MNLKTVAIVIGIILLVHVTFIQLAKAGLFHTDTVGHIKLGPGA